MLKNKENNLRNAVMARAYYRNGFSMRTIAEKLGVRIPTVSKYVNATSIYKIDLANYERVYWENNTKVEGIGNENDSNN